MDEHVQKKTQEHCQLQAQGQDKDQAKFKMSVGMKNFEGNDERVWKVVMVTFDHLTDKVTTEKAESENVVAESVSAQQILTENVVVEKAAEEKVAINEVYYRKCCSLRRKAARRLKETVGLQHPEGKTVLQNTLTKYNDVNCEDKKLGAVRSHRDGRA